jgi:uncharacterized protein
MADRSEYAPGTFCWAELATSDQAGAKAFYAGLFGWEADDRPVGDGVYYSMQSVGAKNVAAIAAQPEQQREAGVPPLWNSYVSVDSADAAAELAASLGATVHAPAFDVMDVGRMAVIQDPQGAYVMVWQPREHFGAGLVNAPGALTWNELQSPDPQASASFYGGLFGWSTEQAPGMSDVYLLVKNAGANNGGIRELGPGMPPSWLVYFATDDIDAALAKVRELGGTTIVPTMDIGVAKIAVVSDPQGAVFALYAGALED